MAFPQHGDIYIEKNDMNRYEEQDKKIRTRFVKDFQRYIYHYKFAGITESIDVYFTGHTKDTYKVELKERKYTSTYLIDNGAFLEAPKLRHFKELYLLNPSYTLLFFNYTTDGTISYNITNRLKNKSPDLLEPKFIQGIEKDHFGDRTPKDRYISILMFNPDLGDKRTFINKQ